MRAEDAGGGRRGRQVGSRRSETGASAALVGGTGANGRGEVRLAGGGAVRERATPERAARWLTSRAALSFGCLRAVRVGLERGEGVSACWARRGGGDARPHCWAAGTGEGSASFCVGAGPSGREMGQARGEEGEGLGQLAGWADFWVWAGFGFPISLVFLSFLFQTHSNYFEFKRNLNSTLGTQPNKTYALA